MRKGIKKDELKFKKAFEQCIKNLSFISISLQNNISKEKRRCISYFVQSCAARTQVMRKVLLQQKTDAFVSSANFTEFICKELWVNKYYSSTVFQKTNVVREMNQCEMQENQYKDQHCVIAVDTEVSGKILFKLPEHPASFLVMHFIFLEIAYMDKKCVLSIIVTSVSFSVILPITLHCFGIY